MSMSFDERVALSGRIAAASMRSPKLYLARVIAWMVFGYVLIASIIAGSLLLGLSIILMLLFSRLLFLLYLGIVPLFFSWSLLRALFVKVDPPEGRVVRRHEAPKLFRMIDEIREATHVRRLDCVMFDAAMNAAIVETPRFGGIFGWRRHLIIGLPLMLTHSTDHFRAVLAHELGHLSSNHGRMSAWAWRVRETWGRILASVRARRSVSAKNLDRLFTWYVDRLNAVTVALSRAHELAADRISAEVTSPLVASRSLAWHVVSDFLVTERLWQPLFARVAEMESPRLSPMDELLHRRAEVLAGPYDETLAGALGADTTLDDSHPCLRERLEAMGVASPDLAAPEVSAAQDLLGRSLGTFVNECDAAWRMSVRESWRARHEVLRQAREVVAEEAGDVTSIDDERLLERADSLAELERNEEAEELYRIVAERRPDSARTAYSVGALMIARGELSGIEHISRAMQLDWQCVIPSCELVYAALCERGLHADADAWRLRFEQQQEIVSAAQAEAATIDRSAVLGETRISEDQRRVILEKAREARWIRRVWFARRTLRALPVEMELVFVDARMFSVATGRKLQALADAVGSGVDATFMLVGDQSWLRSRLKKLPHGVRM